VTSERIGVEKIDQHLKPCLVGDIELTPVGIAASRISQCAYWLVYAYISAPEKGLIGFGNQGVVVLNGELKDRSDR
jgi:hypothetical protein